MTCACPTVPGWCPRHNIYETAQQVALMRDPTYRANYDRVFGVHCEGGEPAAPPAPISNSRDALPLPVDVWADLAGVSVLPGAGDGFGLSCWPGAVLLAEEIGRRTWKPGETAVDLGAGLGLV